MGPEPPNTTEPPGPGGGASAATTAEQALPRGTAEKKLGHKSESRARESRTASMSARVAQPATAAGTVAAATSPALGAALRLGREFAASGAAVGEEPRAGEASSS